MCRRGDNCSCRGGGVSESFNSATHSALANKKRLQNRLINNKIPTVPAMLLSRGGKIIGRRVHVAAHTRKIPVTSKKTLRKRYRHSMLTPAHGVRLPRSVKGKWRRERRAKRAALHKSAQSGLNKLKRLKPLS